MLRNYIKIAFRNLWKSKGFTLINVSGLAIGITCCLLIILFVRHELSYDKFHQKSERIYRLSGNVTTNGVQRQWGFLLTNIFEKIRTSLPEIEESTSFNFVKTNQETIVIGEKRYDQTKGIFLADSSFFKVFDFEFIHGTPQEALNGPNKIVLTEQQALKLFGKSNALGELLEIENLGNLQVSGIVEEPPSNSHFDFDYLVSLYTIPDYIKSGTLFAYSYVVFPENFDLEPIQQKISKLIQPLIEGPFKSRGANYEVNFVALEAIHLESKVNYELGANGEKSYVVAFTIIAIFILAIACLNFMNLSTAKSSRRSREVGLRKVFGAHRRQLVPQFLGESFLLSGISIVLAMGLTALVIPYFNHLTGKEFSADLIFEPFTLLFLFVLFVSTSFFAGSYPAFHLASFQPISALKGQHTKGSRGGNFRKYLVVIQFSISIALIICTQVVIHQINFMQGQNLGFDKDEILVLPIEKGQSWTKYNRLKRELKSLPQVLSGSFSASIPGRRQNRANMSLGEGSTAQSFIFHSVYVDFDYLETYGIEIIEGRNFSPALVTDTTNFLVNSTVLEKLGKDSILGMKLRFPGPGIGGEVIGVVNDIYYKTLKEEVEPMIITGLTSQLPFDVNFLSLKMDMGADIQATIASIEETWNKVYPDKSFNSFFLNDDLNNQYSAEKSMSELLITFAALAIFIACLGLFGLATHTARQRIKEVGIRKVLGASVLKLIILMSTEFTYWIIGANLIAWTSAYYLMNNWMQDFAHRSIMPWQAFILSTIGSFAIAWLTIFHQTRKAATRNPVTALRHQ